MTDALAFAHARGIVHRDLKPANIMLDEREQVKVMDFGIAAAAGGETLTLTGQVLGTPKYMAPEQARGEEVDGRTDLFSLGMTMCEMLAGRTPLDGKDVVSAFGMLLQREPPFELGLPADVPPDVQAIVVRLTQKEREARYPTAAALAKDLARARACGACRSSVRRTRPTIPSRQCRSSAPWPRRSGDVGSTAARRGNTGLASERRQSRHGPDGGGCSRSPG